LHDGRACSAIEAAFLHDGPAIKELKVIEGLKALTDTELRQLRAFYIRYRALPQAPTAASEIQGRVRCFSEPSALLLC
jgi:hypothetical protein